jgi:hypothetical protein
MPAPGPGKEPLVDVEITDEAPAHDAPIPVEVALVTRDGAPADQILQRQGSPLAAAPVRAGCIETGLPVFRRIDSIKAYPLAVDLDRVAVDHRGDSDRVGRRGRHEQQ